MNPLGKHVLFTIPFSGILIGLNAPGFGTNWVGLTALVPLLILLNHIFTDPKTSLPCNLLATFVACWLTGGIGSSIGAYWITHSVHAFGHLPWPVAVAITFFGYGLEVGLLLWIALVLPLIFIRSSCGWDLPVRTLWFVLVDIHAPRLIDWNFGGLTFSGFSLIEQAADLIGSAGLSFFSIGCNFLLLGWWHWKTGKPVSFRLLVGLSAVLVVLFAAGMTYGFLKLQMLAEEKPLNTKSRLWIGALQPNLTLRHLASNPELAYSQRVRNLDQLFLDSEEVLKQYPPDSKQSRLIILPESVYPDAFFKSRSSRKRVLEWASLHRTAVLLTSVDWEQDAEGGRYYGISVLVGPEGQILGRYNKIFLIPFGEMLPFSDWFPGFADWMRNQIRNMSEFKSGTEYTVFRLQSHSTLSAPVCFDIFSRDIVRNMTRNGAGLIANLSNLAWFGLTNATDSMEAFARWRAIENRVPVLFVSNNGSSVFIGADGKSLSPRLKLFETGFIIETVETGSHDSFFREHGEWIGPVYLVLMLLTVWLFRIGRRDFSRRNSESSSP